MQTKDEKSTYTLLSTTLTVIYKDKVENDEGCWVFGLTHFDADDATIYISTKNANGKKLNKRSIEATLRHELFHFILDMLYFREQSQNETLVEWLANATYELNKQGLKI